MGDYCDNHWHDIERHTGLAGWFWITGAVAASVVE